MNSLQENGNCLLAHATFRVLGPALDPEDVTRALGLQPTQALRRDQLVPMAAHVRRQESGVWLLKSEGLISSTSLERHLIHLLDLIEPRADALRELRREQDVSADFFCFWMSATGHGGPIFSADVMLRVARVGAELGIDFYGGVDDDTGDLAPAPATRLTVVPSPDR